MINSMKPQNSVAVNLAKILQANNEVAGEAEDCTYLQSAVDSWLNLGLMNSGDPRVGSENNTFVLWAQIFPPRCDYDSGVITRCNDTELQEAYPVTCKVWDDSYDFGATNVTETYFARALDVRVGGIKEVYVGDSEYNVRVIYNMNHTVALA